MAAENLLIVHQTLPVLATCPQPASCTARGQDRFANMGGVMATFWSSGIARLRTLLLVAGLIVSLPSVAAVHLIFERDIDVPGQTDLFLVSYASQADFLSNTLQAQTALPQAIAGNFSLGGFHIDVAAPPPNGVPEPGSAPLLGLGVMMLWLCRRVARGAASGRDGCRPFEAPWLGKLNALRLPAPAG